MKTKIRSYVDKTTDFCSRKKPETGSNYIHWSVLVINSVLKKDENCYPQVFLKECRYIEKEKKWLDIFLLTIPMNLMKNKLKLSIMIGDLKKTNLYVQTVFVKR